MKRRLRRKQYGDQPKPMMSASNIHYELAGRSKAISCGGLGVFHTLVGKIGLVDEINGRLELLKRHLPYHESDHVLNLAYNVLVGHKRLEDIELLRNDESYMDALGAERIPDPTTAGDFTRRFSAEDIDELQEIINTARRLVWDQQRKGWLEYAIIDADGTMAPTEGQTKEGMDINHQGIWGYHPLILTLANTGEHLYLVNRPGNRPSHDGAAEYMNRAADVVRPYAGGSLLSGRHRFSVDGTFRRLDGRGA